MTVQTATRRRKRDVLGSLRQPKVAVMLALGFSSGLPFLLSGNTLGYWLRDEGTTLKAIGFLSWVGLAYSLKFLWAPVIDRVDAPVFGRLGRRRGWMVLAQLLVAAGLVGMSAMGLGAGLARIGAVALLVAFASATQDIVVDAWRIEAAADSDELGLLSAAYQLGYRAALLVTDALILISASHLRMADFLHGHGRADGSGTDGEPPGRGAGPGTGRSQGPSHRDPCMTGRGFFDAVVGPFAEFFRTHGWLALLMLAMISLYRLPEFVMGPMANPFYHDLGFTKDVVGAVRGTFGLSFSLLGIAAGGFSALRFGYVPTLIVGVILQSVVIAAFAILAYAGPDVGVFGAVMAVDSFGDQLRGRRAGHLHVEPDERRLHRDAVRAPELDLRLRRQVREGLLGGDRRAAGRGTHAPRGLRPVLHRRRARRHPSPDPVYIPGARRSAAGAGPGSRSLTLKSAARPCRKLSRADRQSVGTGAR